MSLLDVMAVRARCEDLSDLRDIGGIRRALPGTDGRAQREVVLECGNHCGSIA